MRTRKNSNGNFFTSFDGTKIYYEIRGGLTNKKIMLFLHGLGGNVTAWNPYCEFFIKQGYSTITLDLRGHGFSGRPRGKKAYSLENLAKDVLILIEMHRLKDIILVGQCVGGMVAMILVGKYEVKPKALILIGTGYKLPLYLSVMERPKALSLLYYALSKLPLPLGKPGHANLVKFRGTGTISLARFTSDVIHCTAQSYLGICSNLLAFDGSSLLSKISSPTFIIHGTKDIIFPKATVLDLQKRIRHAQLVFIKNANHILVINNPEEVIHVMNTYLLSDSFPSFAARETSPFSLPVFVRNPV